MGASQCAHGPGERMKISSAFGSSPNDAVAVAGETERSVPLFASGKLEEGPRYLFDLDPAPGPPSMDR